MTVEPITTEARARIKELLEKATPAVGASGYMITEDGVVISVASNWRGYGPRVLTQAPNDDGYPSVRLVIEGRRKRVAVHVLLATTFLGPRPSPAHEVRHLDGNKTRSVLANIAWGTTKENAQDRVRHGRDQGAANGRASAWKLRGIPKTNPARGATIGAAKLTDPDVTDIRASLAAGSTGRALARRYGVNETTISSIKRRLTWTHL